MESQTSTISVRWQSTNGPDRVPVHGFDFHEDTGLNVTYDPNSKYPLPEAARYWYDYTIMLADRKSGCVRVWVDDEIVWDYEHDWYYSMSDLRARVWRSDAGSSPEAENVQVED